MQYVLFILKDNKGSIAYKVSAQSHVLSDILIDV